jgi:diaminohydroxyphosphoribosylaminopyrimidine deaminase/5-amino-6-(5-phosphoribosylamino)uracil reductase
VDDQQLQQRSAHERDALARAAALALHGPRGRNPQVGCVLLGADGCVLAEGWHRGAGTAHAEVDALTRLTSDRGEGAARGATAVVTLEPCNHTGRTGPCAEALVAAGVARVVYAVADPGDASGGGAERLRAAGVDVEHVPTTATDALVADWVLASQRGRPRVTVKWAQSLDGRAAAADGTSQWITGDAAREHVHAQRSAHDAIMVGTGTVLADDPRLTARGHEAQPLPVVLGTRRVPADARVRDHPRDLVQLAGPLDAALAALWEQGVQSVYVEGGPTLASAMVRERLADRIHVYVAPTLLGGPRTAVADLGVDTISGQLRLTDVTTEQLGDDILVAGALAEED